MDLGQRISEEMRGRHDAMLASDELGARVAKACNVPWSGHELERAKLLDEYVVAAIAGRFSVGKSTLISALATLQSIRMTGGRLAAGLLPTTVSPMTFAYGEPPRAVLVWRDGMREEIPLDGLSDQRLDPNDPRYDDLLSIEVTLPARALEHLRLIDTCGLSEGAVRTAKTKSAIARADLITVVFRCDGMGGIADTEERAALDAVNPDQRPCFIVLNCFDGDQPTDEEQKAVWNKFVAKRLGPLANGRELRDGRIFMVDAEEALTGRQLIVSDDPERRAEGYELLAHSGILAYEEAISTEALTNVLGVKSRAWIPPIIAALHALDDDVLDTIAELHLKRTDAERDRKRIDDLLERIDREGDQIAALLAAVKPRILAGVRRTWNDVMGSMRDYLAAAIASADFTELKGVVARLKLIFDDKPAREKIEAIVGDELTRRMRRWASDADDPTSGAHEFSRILNPLVDEVAHRLSAIEQECEEIARRAGEAGEPFAKNWETWRDAILTASNEALGTAVERVTGESIGRTMFGASVGTMAGVLLLVVIDGGLISIPLMIAGAVIGALIGLGDVTTRIRKAVIKTLDEVLAKQRDEQWPGIEALLSASLDLIAASVRAIYDVFQDERREQLLASRSAVDAEVRRYDAQIVARERDRAEIAEHLTLLRSFVATADREESVA